MNKAIDLTDILKPFLGKDLWVALDKSQKKVIASGKTIKEVVDKAKSVSRGKPVLMRTKQEYNAYVPSSQ